MSEELAWAAGIFEATGTSTLSNGVPMLNIKQRAVDGKPPEMVERFHAAIERRGKIGGPYQENLERKPGRRPAVMWYARGADAFEVIRLLWPWLSPSKRAQWDALGQR